MARQTQIPSNGVKDLLVLDRDLEPIVDATEEDTEEVHTERKKMQEDELICHG